MTRCYLQRELKKYEASKFKYLIFFALPKLNLFLDITMLKVFFCSLLCPVGTERKKSIHTLSHQPLAITRSYA